MTAEFIRKEWVNKIFPFLKSIFKVKKLYSLILVRETKNAVAILTIRYQTFESEEFCKSLSK